MADEWVTQFLRQGDAKVFKKYSQMKLQMKREALAKLNGGPTTKGVLAQLRLHEGFWHSFGTVGAKMDGLGVKASEKSFVFREILEPPAGIEPATC